VSRTDLLPASPYAEKLVLGSIILNGSRFEEFQSQLSRDDFSLEAHRLIWDSFDKLREAGGTIDRVTLYCALRDAGHAEAVGGIGYITDLDAGLPDVHDLDSYARVVREKAVRRRIIIAARQIALDAMDETKGTLELLDAADSSLGLLAGLAARRSEWRSPAEVIDAHGGVSSYLTKRQTPGITTPWATVNEAIIDMQPGDLIVVAGATSRGKTTLALNIAAHAILHGHQVGLCSLEMGAAQIVDKLISYHGRVSTGRIRRPRDENDTRAIMGGASSAYESALHIRETGNDEVGSILSAARRLKATRGCGLLIVDYLQLVRGDGRSRYEQVSDVARKLKLAAMELQIPVIAVSQFKRPNEDRPPVLEDLKDSGEIENSANIALLLHGKTSYSPSASNKLDCDLFIAKNRMGARNIGVKLTFYADIGRFEETT
jgi:replicative DNA helicase